MAITADELFRNSDTLEKHGALLDECGATYLDETPSHVIGALHRIMLRLYSEKRMNADEMRDMAQSIHSILDTWDLDDNAGLCRYVNDSVPGSLHEERVKKAVRYAIGETWKHICAYEMMRLTPIDEDRMTEIRKRVHAQLGY